MKFGRITLAVITVLLFVASMCEARHISAMGRGPVEGDGDEAKHEISAKDLKARLDKNEKVVMIDARSHVNGQMLKGAIHLPADKLEEWARSADKDTFIVTYCTCPHDEAAEEEMRHLRGLGFARAYSLTGGLEAARAAGIETSSTSE
jgi:rhodanese-related sulfurtransferase